MEFVFFKNTGLQFFGDKTLLLERPEDRLDQEFSDFIMKSFEREWLPLSFNGKRNLLMFMPIHVGGGCYEILFSIDTNIYDKSQLHTIHEDDTAFTFTKEVAISGAGDATLKVRHLA